MLIRHRDLRGLLRRDRCRRAQYHSRDLYLRLARRRVADWAHCAHKRAASRSGCRFDAVGATRACRAFFSVISPMAAQRSPPSTARSWPGLRLPYANLRIPPQDPGRRRCRRLSRWHEHPRRLLKVGAARDTHFRLTGPAVADTSCVAAEDWHFETGEILTGEAAGSRFATEPGTPSQAHRRLPGRTPISKPITR